MTYNTCFMLSVEEVSLGVATEAPEGDSWVPVCRPEDLPKGEQLWPQQLTTAPLKIQQYNVSCVLLQQRGLRVVCKPMLLLLRHVAGLALTLCLCGCRSAQGV